MKKIFLITDYSDTTEKKKKLIELLTNIKNNDYEVALASHISHDRSITDLTDYYFFDKKNDLNYDYEFKIYRTFTAEDFDISFKPLKMFSTHIFAILKILYPSLTFLKSSDYDIVHVIEYDNRFKNFDFLKEIESELFYYDSVIIRKTFLGGTDNEFYTHSGEFFSLNLKNIDYKHIEYNKSEINKVYLDSIAKYVYNVPETVFFEKTLKNLNLKIKESNFLNDNLFYNEENSYSNHKIEFLENNISIYKQNHKFYIFANSINDLRDNEILLIYDDSEIQKIKLKGIWLIEEIKKQKFERIKILVNNILVTEMDKNSDYIVTK